MIEDDLETLADVSYCERVDLSVSLGDSISRKPGPIGGRATGELGCVRIA